MLRNSDKIPVVHCNDEGLGQSIAFADQICRNSNRYAAFEKQRIQCFISASGGRKMFATIKQP